MIRQFLTWVRIDLWRLRYAWHFRKITFSAFRDSLADADAWIENDPDCLEEDPRAEAEESASYWDP